MVIRRNAKREVPDPAPRTGGESDAVPDKDFEVPGDGTVTIPLGRRDQHGSRPERNAAAWGDVNQRLVGGGEVKEHEYRYRDEPVPPDAEENRDKR